MSENWKKKSEIAFKNIKKKFVLKNVKLLNCDLVEIPKIVIIWKIKYPHNTILDPLNYDYDSHQFRKLYRLWNVLSKLTWKDNK
jgi:hypothetical protein